MKQITLIIGILLSQMTLAVAQDLPPLPFSFYSQNGQLAMTVDKKIYTYHSSIKMKVTDAKKKVFGNKKEEGTQDFVFQNRNIIIDMEFGKKSTKNWERTVRVKCTKYEKEVIEHRERESQEIRVKIANNDYSIKIFGLDVLVPDPKDPNLKVAFDGVDANKDVIHLAFIGKLNKVHFKGGVYNRSLESAAVRIAQDRDVDYERSVHDTIVHLLKIEPLMTILDYALFDQGVIQLDHPKYFLSFSRLIYDYETETKKDPRYDFGYNDNMSAKASLFFNSLKNNIYENVH